MQVEFLVYGAIRGFTCWKPVDVSYCELFYGASCKQDTILKCEVAKSSDGTVCTYYNYLRNNNVVSDRDGSFFGMTVRIDGAVCCDVQNMYHILDLLFEKSIVGKILQPIPTSGKYRYLCNTSFNEQDACLRSIEEQFGALFTNTFTASDLVSIPGHLKSQGGVREVNVSDVTKADAQRALLQGEKLYVSPEFPSAQDRKWENELRNSKGKAEQQIQSVRNQCEQELQSQRSQLDRERADMVTRNNQLSDKIGRIEKDYQAEKSQLETTLKATERELKQAQDKLRKQSDKADVAKVVKDIKEPLARLSTLMDRLYSSDMGQASRGQSDGPIPWDAVKSSRRRRRRLDLRKCLLVLGALLLLGVIIMSWHNTAVVKDKVDSISFTLDSINAVQPPAITR